VQILILLIAIHCCEISHTDAKISSREQLITQRTMKLTLWRRIKK